MVAIKDFLVQQTAEAFSGRADMSLMASLKGVAPEEATWTPDEAVPTIEQLVRHVAWAKSWYCHEGFGTPMAIVDASCNELGDTPGLSEDFPCGAGWGSIASPGIGGAIALLEQTHRVLVGCLESCTEESLGQPIRTRHGKSAGHFFSVMVMHDLYHAGQIRTRRTMQAST